MNHKKRLLIDFDGVIHKYSKGWHDGSIYDGAVEGALDKLQMLHDAGFELVIFSTRCEGLEWAGKPTITPINTILTGADSGRFNCGNVTKLDQKNYNVLLWFIVQEQKTIKQGLRKEPYTFINNLYFTNIKLPALAYIDDRGIRFTNWEDIVKYFI